ncbi:MAG: RNA methyltransferase [Eubacterium sp.]|nr:RNA methyltransferase [Eubacterium sp.]
MIGNSNCSYRLIRIETLNLPELEVYKLRNEVQLLRINEPDPGIFICESAKVLRRALDAGYEPISILTSLDNPDEEIRRIYEVCANVPIYYGDDQVLRELSGYALTGGLFAAMKRRKMSSVEEMVADKNVIAVLENVQNPTNIGAIFRSAAAMGVEAVILTSDCSDPLYRRSERVSMGTVFQIPWTKIDKKCDYISILADKGFATVAMALSDNSVSIRDDKIKEEKRLAIILGNEGYGLSEETIKRSNYVAKIPMNPVVDSLNVGAASAVMFWEISRDRL